MCGVTPTTMESSLRCQLQILGERLCSELLWNYQEREKITLPLQFKLIREGKLFTDVPKNKKLAVTSNCFKAIPFLQILPHQFVCFRFISSYKTQERFTTDAKDCSHIIPVSADSCSVLILADFYSILLIFPQGVELIDMIK